MKRFLALLTALLLLLGFACAEEAAQPALLTAVGASPVECDRQTAVLTFALCAEAETADAAKALMEASGTALMALLSEQGVAEEDVQLIRYDMARVYDYHHTRLSENKLLKGFKLDVGLKTRLADAQQARVIVDALFASTLDADYQLAFESASSAEAEDAALALAAQEAARKAQLLCQSMGLSLGELVSVQQTVEDGLAQVEAVYTAE